MFVFHCKRLSLLNFCSSERIVSEGTPDIARVVLVVYCMSLYGYTTVLID